MYKRKTSVCPGDKFGHLTIKEFSSTKGNWLCICECGGTTFVEATRLKNGNRKACGCALSYKPRPHKQLPDDLGPKRDLYRTYKSNAKLRKIEFDLDFEFFIDLIECDCVYCGRSKTNTLLTKTKTKRHERRYQYTGIDRVNNNLGYVKNNCVACCKMCNISKSTYSREEWLKWIVEVYQKSIT